MRRVHFARFLWGVLLTVLAVLAYGAAKRFLRADGYGDFHVFHDAFRAVLAGEDLYASGVGGYIYPPLFAVVFAPLGWLSQGAAAVVWTVLNCGMIVGCFWLAADEFTRRFDARRGAEVVPAIMLVAFLLLVDKFKSELRLGQTDMIVLLGLLLPLRWVEKRPVLAGIAMGFVGHIKYQSLVVLPYLLIRGRWRALVSTGFSLAGFALATSVVFGWERNLDYLRRGVGGLGRLFGSGVEGGANIYGISWIRSISVPSALARLQEWAGWPGWALPVLVLVAAAIALAGVLWLYRRNGHTLFVGRSHAHDDASPRAGALVALEWTGLIVAVLVFSPQTTARHMVIVMPLLVLAGMLLVVRHGGVRRLPVLAAAVFLLLALVLPPGSGDDNKAVHAWRTVGGISIATLTLLYVSLAGGLKWAATLPDHASAGGR